MTLEGFTASQGYKPMLSTGDVLKVVVAFTMPDNVTMQLVTHYLVGTGDDIDEDDTLNAIRAVLATAWANIEDYVSTLVLGQTIKLSLWDATLKQFDEVSTQPISGFDGEGIGTMMPHGAAALARFFTNQGRRQGRKYVSGVLAVHQVDGDLVSAFVTVLALFAADWITGVVVDTTNVNQGVFNQPTESFKGFVQSSAANTIVAYQRRRKSGVGI